MRQHRIHVVMLFKFTFVWLYVKGFPLQNNPKNLDPSYKMDLDFGDCLKKENPSCSIIIHYLYKYLVSFLVGKTSIL